MDRIDFDENWNNKLLGDVFSTIRPGTKKYNLQGRYAIYLKDRFFCYADIIAIDKFTLDEIMERKIHLTDTGRTDKDFLELIESFYGKKTWWKDGETQLYVLYFKKIVQTSLFDQLP